jgi:hypothetical protein
MTRYLRELYKRLVCAHCGKPQSMTRGGGPQVILHHPDGNGDRGRVSQINNKSTRAGQARIRAEVRRCNPLCRSCHGIEHERMRVAAGKPTAHEWMRGLRRN